MQDAIQQPQIDEQEFKEEGDPVNIFYSYLQRITISLDIYSLDPQRSFRQISFDMSLERSGRKAKRLVRKLPRRKK